jgi:DNA-binding NtrC family response regulator
MKIEILLVEDDPALATSLERVLGLAGYNVTVAESAENAFEHATNVRCAAVVTDFKLPRLTGLDLVNQLRMINPRLPIILMTAHSTADLAIEAIKRGAYDYLVKPFEMSALLTSVEHAIRHSRIAIDSRKFSDQEDIPSTLVGNGPAMQTVYKEIGRVAATPTAVLIRGESGTGKELVARAIWRHSNRATKPFVAVNCTAIPETLIETEMFGHERGAFTGADARRVGRFEQAESGTIFLDRNRRHDTADSGKVASCAPGEKRPARGRTRADLDRCTRNRCYLIVTSPRRFEKVDFEKTCSTGLMWPA